MGNRFCTADPPSYDNIRFETPRRLNIHELDSMETAFGNKATYQATLNIQPHAKYTGLIKIDNRSLLVRAKNRLA